jgi:hypothetical protein
VSIPQRDLRVVRASEKRPERPPEDVCCPPSRAWLTENDEETWDGWGTGEPAARELKELEDERICADAGNEKTSLKGIEAACVRVRLRGPRAGTRGKRTEELL